MKVTVYAVEVVDEKTNDTLITFIYESKEEALKRAESSSYNSLLYRYVGPREKEIDLRCRYCGKELQIGDDYIRIDLQTRYCKDCYETTTSTYYTVDGELVGDGTSVVPYDSRDKEF